MLHKPLHRSVICHDYPVAPHSLGQRLKRIRLDLGLQIKQVAATVGLSEGTIIDWEYDRLTPRSDPLDRLRKFYRGHRHPLVAQL